MYLFERNVIEMRKFFAYTIFLVMGIFAAQAFGDATSDNGNAANKFDEDTPWILPGFDKNDVYNAEKYKKHRWISSYYIVRYEINGKETKLSWKHLKSNTQVEMQVSADGDSVKQDWQYQGNHVSIAVNDDGSVEQNWKFGDSSLKVNKNLNTSQWNGPKKPEDVEKFKKFIDIWCDHNDFFVGKNNCAVYSKTKLRDDPGWIIPDFDKNEVSKLGEQESKGWEIGKYNVGLIKLANKTTLQWKNKKDNIKVKIEISKDGKTVQDWIYQGNQVHIESAADNTRTEVWNLGKSKYQLNKKAGQKKIARWNGPKDSKALKNFQKFINSWCDNNDFFVGKENCSIYTR